MATGTPRSQPSAPATATLAVASGTSLNCVWAKPANDGGSAVSKYKVEWYTAAGTAEVQQITTSAKVGITEKQTVRVASAANNLGGFFKLSFNGQTTDNIAFNALAVGLLSVKEKLERLSTVGTVSVTRAESKIAVGTVTAASRCQTASVSGCPFTTNVDI